MSVNNIWFAVGLFLMLIMQLVIINHWVDYGTKHMEDKS